MYVASGDVVKNMPWVLARHKMLIMRYLRKMKIGVDKSNGVKYDTSRKVIELLLEILV